MARRNNLRFKIYPNLSKKSKKTGLTPLYLKATFKNDKSEMRLSESFDLDNMAVELWDYRFMSIGNKKYEKINDELQGIKAQWVKYLKNNNDSMNHSLEKILKIVTNKDNQSVDMTILKYCEKYLLEIKDTNKIGDGTKTNIKKAINHLTKYLKKEKNEKMLLKEFKYIDAKKFDLYMSSPNGANNEATSITGNIIKLKAMFKEAIKEELLINNPFEGIKLKYTSENKTPYITINQISDFIKNEYIKENKELAFYRDIFIFAVFTGLNYIDIKNMDRKYLLPVFDNRYKYDNQRSKTGKTIIQIIPKPAQKIIDKYNGMSNDSIFPKFWSQTFNDKLKIMSGIIGLNLGLTSKIARTSCNQVLINVGGFDSNYKRAYMGWSNSNDISYVYTTIVDDILLRNTNNIENYYRQNLGENYLNLI